MEAEGNGFGEFVLTTSTVTGKDASNRAVSGARATAQGQVVAFLVGLEQRPKRVALSQDNNNDGKTNELDRLVQLIVSVKNLTQQSITNLQTSKTN